MLMPKKEREELEEKVARLEEVLPLRRVFQINEDVMEDKSSGDYKRDTEKELYKYLYYAQVYLYRGGENESELVFFCMRVSIAWIYIVVRCLYVSEFARMPQSSC